MPHFTPEPGSDLADSGGARDCVVVDLEQRKEVRLPQAKGLFGP